MTPRGILFAVGVVLLALPFASSLGPFEVAQPSSASAESNVPRDVVATFAPTPAAEFVRVRELHFEGLKAFEVVLGPARFEDELPLVVMIHGRGDHVRIPSGDHHDTPPVRLLLPQAPEPFRAGYTWFPLSITDDAPEKVLGHHIQARSDQLARLIRRVVTTRATEGRVIVTGFSQGGMLSLALALREPELFDLAVPMASWLPRYLVEESLDADAIYPEIRLLHGVDDPIVPMAPARALSEELRRRGLPVHFREFPADAHTVTPSMGATQRAIILDAIRARRARARALG